MNAERIQPAGRLNQRNYQDTDEGDDESWDEVPFFEFEERDCQQHGDAEHVQESELNERAVAGEDEDVSRPRDRGDAHCYYEEKDCFFRDGLVVHAVASFSPGMTEHERGSRYQDEYPGCEPESVVH